MSGSTPTERSSGLDARTPSSFWISPASAGEETGPDARRALDRFVADRRTSRQACAVSDRRSRARRPSWVWRCGVLVEAQPLPSRVGWMNEVSRGSTLTAEACACPPLVLGMLAFGHGIRHRRAALQAAVALHDPGRPPRPATESFARFDHLRHHARAGEAMLRTATASFRDLRIRGLAFALLSLGVALLRRKHSRSRAATGRKREVPARPTGSLHQQRPHQPRMARLKLGEIGVAQQLCTTPSNSPP